MTIDMKSRFVLFGLLSILLASCSLDETIIPNDGAGHSGARVFYATIDERSGVDTKVYADENLSILWNVGDYISIFDMDSGNDQYVLDGEVETSSGMFKPCKDFSEEGALLDAVYAVYPYSRETFVDYPGTISLSLPEEQAYKENSFGIGANTMISVSNDDKLKFKNVGGYLLLKFYGDDVTVSSIELRGNNGERISGRCIVEMSVGGTPALTMDESAGDKITLVCNPPLAIGTTADEPTMFWFVVPPVTFQKGFTVTVTTPEGTVFEKSTGKECKIGRSAITKYAALKVEPRGSFIVFADPNVKAELLMWDTDNDGELSYAEAESISSLGYVFNNTSGITSFDEFQFFTGITSVQEWDFYNCSSLESIVLPESITSIGEGAFYGCSSLKTVVIPASVTSLSRGAFYDCSRLASVTVEAVNTPTGGDYMFEWTDNCPIFVPAESVEAYKSAEYWSRYADRIFPIGFVPVTSLTLDVSTLELEKESSYTFTATILPENATNKEIIWTSSDASIATVSQEGVVTALQAGSATITAQCDNKKAVCKLSVISKSNPSYYSSSDYTQDGEVVLLQQASVGKGINIIFLGDGFLDTDMAAGGKYDQKMNEAMEQFFAYEPYTTFRDRFNVYAVRVVSQNAEYAEDSNRRLTFNEGNSFGMRTSVCTEYASKILNPEGLPLKIGVITNSEGRVGRSICYYDSSGWCCGFVLQRIGDVLNHEVGGHGFANLLDEYVEQGYEGRTFSDTETLDNRFNNFGWGANVDWRSDPSTVRWSRFLSDDRYDDEGLGMYEGAYLYPLGIYRPTENSMMRYNDTPFNAPSREQIYKTIMKYSEGSNWVYDYEAFVAADAAGRSQAAAAFSVRAASSSVRRAPSRSELPLPPVLIDQDVKVVLVDEDGKVVKVR